MKMAHRIGNHGVAAAAALLAGMIMAPAAQAQLTLRYEENFGTHLAGDAFSGQFRINLQNFDMGTIYPTLGAPGTAAGFGANGTGPQTVAGGVSTLNAAQAIGTTGAQNVPTVVNGVAQPGSSGPEDSWGIARIISITDLDGGIVWSEAGKNQQITTFFYGEKDFYVNQLANGFQQIHGVGLRVDLYLQDKTDPGYTAYDPLLGSLGRTGPSTYTSVTDGSLILSTVSAAGFINDAGTLGGLATEFISVFNASSGGTAQAYLSVTGGTEAARFNTNFYSSTFIPGATADLFSQFTTVISTSASDWLVRSNDPVTGNFVPVPEPSTYGMAAAAALVGVVVLRRRARQSAAV
ncbi:MAG: hypothetical protein B9S34_09105 [Opitutia bacterium Tous-C1TDCM]|nr:MAG: hypothetical protein B9S34_09105 [Opitutae bacterium Tous-C1TDCM]